VRSPTRSKCTRRPGWDARRQTCHSRHRPSLRPVECLRPSRRRTQSRWAQTSCCFSNRSSRCRAEKSQRCRSHPRSNHRAAGCLRASRSGNRTTGRHPVIELIHAEPGAARVKSARPTSAGNAGPPSIPDGTPEPETIEQEGEPGMESVAGCQVTVLPWTAAAATFVVNPRTLNSASDVQGPRLPASASYGHF